ncbi:MAG: hypothetical protein AAFV29_24950 [Myxococcota bacterium]
MTVDQIQILPLEPASEGWGGWPRLAWKRPSVVLVAVGPNRAAVLDYEGVYADYASCESGDLDEAFDHLEPGFYVASEFRSVDTTTRGIDGVDYDYEYSFETRPATEAELLKHARGEPVFERDPFAPSDDDDDALDGDSE